MSQLSERHSKRGKRRRQILNLLKVPFLFCLLGSAGIMSAISAISYYCITFQFCKHGSVTAIIRKQQLFSSVFLPSRFSQSSLWPGLEILRCCWIFLPKTPKQIRTVEIQSPARTMIFGDCELYKAYPLSRIPACFLNVRSLST